MRAGRRAALAAPLLPVAAALLAGHPARGARAQTAPATGAAAGAEPRLAELFTRLGRASTRPRRFVERRHSALFVAPEESRGVLRFEPPATFEKRTETPTAEVLRLDERTATVRRGGSAPTSLALDAHPSLAALARGLRAAASGDLGTLEAAFEVRLEDEGGGRWRVLAVPRDPGAARFLARLELGGTGDRLERITVHERSGDRSELWLIDEAPRR